MDDCRGVLAIPGVVPNPDAYGDAHQSRVDEEQPQGQSGRQAPDPQLNPKPKPYLADEEGHSHVHGARDQVRVALDEPGHAGAQQQSQEHPGEGVGQESRGQLSHGPDTELLGRGIAAGWVLVVVAHGVLRTMYKLGCLFSPSAAQILRFTAPSWRVRCLARACRHVKEWRLGARPAPRRGPEPTNNPPA